MNPDKLPFICGEFHCMWTRFENLDFRRHEETIGILLTTFRRNVRELVQNANEYSGSHINKLVEIKRCSLESKSLKRRSGNFEIQKEEKKMRKSSSYKKVQRDKISQPDDKKLDLVQSIDSKKPMEMISAFEFIVTSGFNLLRDFPRKKFKSKKIYRKIVTGIVGGIGLSTAFVVIIMDAFNVGEGHISKLTSCLFDLSQEWQKIKNTNTITNIIKKLEEITKYLSEQNIKDAFSQQITDKRTRLGFEDHEFVKEFCEDGIIKLRKITKEVARMPSFVNDNRRRGIFSKFQK